MVYYIIIFSRSKNPTARLRLGGVSVETLEKSGDFVTPEQNQYIVLKKRSRTKLVLNADSEPEFLGWLKTLQSVTQKLKEAGEIDKNASIETESNLTKAESERGRSRTRGWGKAPVPTPRSKTPSREEPPVSGKRHMEDKVRSQAPIPDVFHDFLSRRTLLMTRMPRISSWCLTITTTIP